MDRLKQLIRENVPEDMPEFRRSTVVALLRLAYEEGKNEILQKIASSQDEKGGES